MKLLVRLRRLAVAINPERRLKIESPGSRCQPSQSKTTMATTRKQPHRKNGSDARCSASLKLDVWGGFKLLSEVEQDQIQDSWRVCVGSRGSVVCISVHRSADRLVCKLGRF